MREQRKAQGSSSFYTTQLFDKTGFHLEPSILDHDLIMSTREFLNSRRQRLHELFEEWVGSRVADSTSYAWHQQRLSAYDSRAIPKDHRHFLTGEFDLETRLHPNLTRLLSTERCRDFVCSFLRVDRYYVHYPPMIRFKLADAPSSIVPVHQDIVYNRHLTDFITVWVPLVDIDDECGGIIVYEGSHLADVVEHEGSGAWAHRAASDLSKYPSHHVIMNAGDLLLFPPTLLHESAPHYSSRIRYSVDFRVFRHESETMKSYYDPFKERVSRAGDR